MIKIWISNLEFSGGINIALQESSILVIVGPNNSGKSATLSNIIDRLRGRQSTISPLKKIRIARETGLEEIKESFRYLMNSNSVYVAAQTSGGGSIIFHDHDFEKWWDEESESVGEFITGQIVSELTTRSRLGDCDPQSNLDMRSPYVALHPFQHMFRNPDLEIATSEIFRKAFKSDFVLHRGSGNLIPAYVGARPKFEAGEDRISLSYVKRVEQLDPLETQGDGIRSFVSIVAHVLTEDRPIQLIDEPEAFLHPPQARMVAETVASFGGGRQSIVATHSSDVLQGLLNNHSGRVSVIRLTRNDGDKTVSYLDTNRVIELWRDPILRFGKILDGIFHDAVIVTESDGDCRFYESVVTAVTKPEDRPDIHYTYSGGKDRLPIVISALRGVAVPVVTIVDFDVLNSEQPLRRIVESHSGLWSTIEKDWQSLKTAVEMKATFLGGKEFRAEILKEIGNFGDQQAVPQDTLKRIQKLARRASPWENIKNSGISVIPQGEPTITANRLLNSLKKIGIFVAPNGEMEGFCRSIGAHGPRWVEAVLQKDIAKDEELEAARAFARSIISYFRSAAG